MKVHESDAKVNQSQSLNGQNLLICLLSCTFLSRSVPSLFPLCTSMHCFTTGAVSSAPNLKKEGTYEAECTHRNKKQQYNCHILEP